MIVSILQSFLVGNNARLLVTEHANIHNFRIKNKTYVSCYYSIYDVNHSLNECLNSLVSLKIRSYLAPAGWWSLGESNS